MTTPQLWLLRAVVAVTWFYQGTYLKLWLQDPHHLQIVQAVGAPFGWTPGQFLVLIGGGETLIGLAVLSGRWPRLIAWFQIALVFAMNAGGILFGQGTIAHPVGLMISNLPFLLCCYLAGCEGPVRSRS